MRTLLTALAIAPVALGLTACGGGDEAGGDGPAVTFQKGEVVKIKGFEYRFEPSNVEVRGGGPTKIEFANAGSLAHNVRIFGGGEDIGGSPTFQGGETRTSTVDLKPGEYELICTVGNHADLGMKGELTVE